MTLYMWSRRGAKLRAHSPLLAAGPLTYLRPVKIFYNHPWANISELAAKHTWRPLINICEILNNNLAESWLSHQSLVKLSGPGLERSGQKFLGPASPLVTGTQCFVILSITHISAHTHTHTLVHTSIRAHSVTQGISTTPAHWHVEMQPRRIRECSIVICALWNRSTNPKCLVMELAFHVDSIALSLFRWIVGDGKAI